MKRKMDPKRAERLGKIVKKQLFRNFVGTYIQCVFETVFF